MPHSGDRNYTDSIGGVLQSEAPVRQVSAGGFEVTERYRQYVAWLLCSVYAFNQVDRQIFAILQQPIKETFHFSDTELGLIGGTAFGLFYATLAVPIGR